MAGDPTTGPATAGWNGVPFTLPPGYVGPPPRVEVDSHRPRNFFGLTVGGRAGGAVEPDVNHH
jgi:hypothetical protein